jgi:hypothetical protein
MQITRKAPGMLKEVLARWQCEKLDQVMDLGRMQKEKTRRKCCAKKGV